LAIITKSFFVELNEDVLQQGNQYVLLTNP